MKNLISATDLIKKLENNEDMVLIDCRFNLLDREYGARAYKEGHIKGAYILDVDKDLSAPITEHGGFNPLADPKELAAKLEKMGIDNNTYIVTYDEGDLNGPSKLMYQLMYMGIKNVDVLDGGIPAFLHAGGTLESEIPEANHTDKKINLDLDEDMIVDMEYVKARLYDPNTIIIDSRSNERYQGIVEPAYSKAGHIPRAKNYFFNDILNDNFENGSYKDCEFLKEHFKDLIGTDKEIILSCGSGIAACVNSLALRQFDVPHKIYPGSFSDWITYEGNEIKTGNE